jgi:hypothetical protein
VEITSLRYQQDVLDRIRSLLTAITTTFYELVTVLAAFPTFRDVGWVEWVGGIRMVLLV